MGIKHRKSVKLSPRVSLSPLLPLSGLRCAFVNYISDGACFFFNKTRRLFVARSKRYLKYRKIASSF